MGTVILIGVAAIVVAIVGCFVIWRLDASRAEEIEHTTPVVQKSPPAALRTEPAAGTLPGARVETDPEPAPPRTLDS